MVNPVGIDMLKPRLSWILEPGDQDTRGLKQVAYRIGVSSSIENLEKGIFDIWDSGRVESDDTCHIMYEGRALRSREWVYWKVKVWNNKGHESSWDDCELAYWYMGILTADEWKAHWIGESGREPTKLKISSITGDLTVEIITSEPSPL
ncbi:MAG: glycoside hydrolase family 78 protein, partial [Promethearchaeota archaeon]